MHPDKIQLCVVLVDWTVESTQELRLGEATGAGFFLGRLHVYIW